MYGFVEKNENMILVYIWFYRENENMILVLWRKKRYVTN